MKVVISKSSSTNYPNGFFTVNLSHIRKMSSYTASADKSERLRYIEANVLLGGYSSEVPPLPIPNREVKLTNADGTAVFPWESR